MTTIAFDGKTLAVDGRSTTGGIITRDNKNKMNLNVGIFSAITFCGDASYGYDFIKDTLCTVRDINELRDTEVREETDFVLVDKKTQHLYLYYSDDSGTFLLRYTYNWAWGSGKFFALAALDFGKTAKEAVKYAATRDIYTNSKVKTYTLKDIT